MISGVLQILSFNIPNTKDFFQLVYGLSSVIWRVDTLFSVLNIKGKALKTLHFFFPFGWSWRCKSPVWCCSCIQHLSANCGLGNLSDNRPLQVLKLSPFHSKTCGLMYNISRPSTIGPGLRWQCKPILKTWQENLNVSGRHCNTEAEHTVAEFYPFDWKLNLIWADKKQQIPWEFSQVAEVCHRKVIGNWYLTYLWVIFYSW